jgi:DNA gyrase subunit A
MVLPTRVPNLLVNGASGIAVGMATNIPPHNLGEVIDALILLLNNAGATLPEIMELLPGPDFPTAGFIYGRSGILDAYATGRGVLQMRARTSFEELRQDRRAIVIEELPYQVNKARLVEKIAQLVNDKRIAGISDLRDESSREGMRVVIEVKRGEEPEIVLNQLFKLTPLQSSFGVILLAIVDGQPRIMPVKEVLSHFLEHRKEVVRRRTVFELEKAERRAHILEGLKKALDHLDAVIELIRASGSPAEAREGLMAQFGFSNEQARAILEMRLQRLTALERDKIVQEYDGVLATIARLREILASEEVLKTVIQEELEEIKQRYSDPRRTVIMDQEAELTLEDLISEEEVVITATRNGYIKRTSLDVYRSQSRGGKGRKGMSTRTAEDLLQYLFVASTHSYLLVFTTSGRVYWLKVYEIPSVGAAGRGRPIVNVINLEKEESVADIVAVDDFERDEYIFMVSRKGYIKRTSLRAFRYPRTTGIIACRVDDDDELFKVKLSSGDDHILLCTRGGKAIRFSERDVRAMGRTARGVRGISLKPGDSLVTMLVASGEAGEVLSVTENGFGKRTELAGYRLQGRGGQGVINIKTSARNGQVVGVSHVHESGDLILITAKGKIIRQPTDQIRLTVSRSAQGVKLIDLEEDDKVADITLVSSESEVEEDAVRE